MEQCPYCGNGTIQSGTCSNCHRMVGDGNRPLPRGTILNQRYRVVRPLGSGGFGVTYRAWDTVEQHPVAIKELFPMNTAVRTKGSCEIQLRKDHADYFYYALRNFKKETETLRTLRNHPEVVRLYSTFEQNGTAYYAMELLDGEDLKTILLRRGPLPWKELAQPMRDVVEAMQFLHDAHLLHRDICPENIFLTSSGKAKLIDFGSVRNYETENHFTTILHDVFSPQELFLKNGNQGPWTDIYLFCATLYYLMSGRLPTHVSQRVADVYAKRSDPLQPLTRIVPSVPSHVAQAVEKGLSIQIADRFQTANELKLALFPYGSGSQTVDPGTGKPAGATGFPPQGRGPVLCASAGNLAGRAFPLRPKAYVTVGRNPDSMVSYPEHTPGVSRNQCLLYMNEAGQVYVMDQNSSYGTYLRGARIPAQRWFPLAFGESIRFGNEELRLLR